jgi:hypothetical protein
MNVASTPKYMGDTNPHDRRTAGAGPLRADMLLNLGGSSPKMERWTRRRVPISALPDPPLARETPAALTLAAAMSRNIRLESAIDPGRLPREGGPLSPAAPRCQDRR